MAVSYDQVAQGYKELRLRQKAGEALDDKDTQRLQKYGEWLQTNMSAKKPSEAPAAPEPAPAPKQDQTSPLGAAGIGLADSVSFGWADEGYGAARAGLAKLQGDPRPAGDIYTQNRDAARQYSDQAWAENPWSYGAGNVAGMVAGPGLGIAKTAKLAKQALPKVFKTTTKAAAVPGAAAGALGGAGVADSPEAVPGAMALGAAGGAAGGMLGNKLGQKVGLIVDDTPIGKFKSLPQELQQDFADRVASYQKRNPDAAKIGIDANEVVNSIFKQLGLETKLQIKKAKLQGKVGEGDKDVLENLKNRVAGKSSVFSAEDEAIAKKIFGPDAWPEIDRAMRLSDMMAKNVGSMQEIIGPIAHAMESRLSSGNVVNAALQKLGLKTLSRKFVQPGNPVNQAGKRFGDPDSMSRVDKLRQEVNQLKKDQDLAKQAERDSRKKAPMEDRGPFDPASLDVPSSYGNPDFLPPVQRVTPNPAADEAAFAQRAAEIAAARKKLASFTQPADAVGDRGLRGSVGAPVDLPTAELNYHPATSFDYQPGGRGLRGAADAPVDVATSPVDYYPPTRFSDSGVPQRGVGARPEVAPEGGGLPTAEVDMTSPALAQRAEALTAQQQAKAADLSKLAETLDKAPRLGGGRVTLSERARGYINGDVTPAQSDAAVEKVLARLTEAHGEETVSAMLKQLDDGKLNRKVYFKIQDAITDQLSQDTGLAVRRQSGKGPNRFGGGGDTPVAPGAQNAPQGSSGGSETMSKAYQGGMRANIALNKLGFTFQDTGRTGPGRIEVTGPDGRILGTGIDYKTAREMAYDAIKARNGMDRVKRPRGRPKKEAKAE